MLFTVKSARSFEGICYKNSGFWANGGCFLSRWMCKG